jgi:hypothetical protein
VLPSRAAPLGLILTCGLLALAVPAIADGAGGPRARGAHGARAHSAHAHAPHAHATHGLTRRLSLRAGQRRALTLQPRSALRLAGVRISGLPGAIRVSVRRTRGEGLRLELRASLRTLGGRYVLHLSAPRRTRRLRAGFPVFRTRVLISVRPELDEALSASGASPPAWPIDDHIPTWAYDDSATAQWCNGGAGASSQLVRAWLTYAESNCGPQATKALSDCHADGTSYCTAVQYLNASRVYQDNGTGILAAAQEGWWLHQPGYSDAQHRLTVSGYGGGYVLDQADPAVQQWFHGYLDANYDAFDGVMLDEMGAGARAWLWGTGFAASQELAGDGAVNAAHEQLAAALTHSDGAPFVEIDNGISPNPWTEMPFSLLGQPASVQGLVSEGVPEDDGQLTPYYSTMLDEMAYIDRTAKDFIALLSYGNAGSLRSRRVQAASVLLGYSPGHTVSWADLEQDNLDLAVWPEEGIVPTQPLQTMAAPGGAGCLAGEGVICSRGGHLDLQVAPGVYRREFGACYEQGAPFGPCAVIVNTTGSPVTVAAGWLRQSYGHEITFSGGDVQSGGTIDTTGAGFQTGTSTVPAQDALLLSR